MRKAFWFLIAMILGWSVGFNPIATPSLGAADASLPMSDSPGGTTVVIAADSNGFSFAEDISDDGRIALFQSTATNLVAEDTNNVTDVFVYEREQGVISRVSIATDGTEGDGDSTRAVLSGDGRYVAFTSRATNLAPADTNNIQDVFWHDRTTGETRPVSAAEDGGPADSYSDVTDISVEGRYVVFRSAATNLVADDSNNVEDVFVRDMQLQTTTRISIASDGTEGNDISSGGWISDEGEWVVFNSRADTLAPGVLADWEIFLHRRSTGETRRLLLNTVPDATYDATAISGNGAYVLLNSDAANLVDGDGNGTRDAFRLEIATGAIALASRTANGDAIYLGAGGYSISDDGRYVLFSTGTNAVPEDTNIFTDFYRRDLDLNRTEWVSPTEGGTRNEEVTGGVLSGDGETVLFGALGTGFVPNQSNGYNVFLRTPITPPPLPTPTPAPHSLYAPAIAFKQGLALYPRLRNLTAHGNDASFAPAVNQDGTVVAFLSDATNLVPDDTNGFTDAFVWRAATNRIQRVSIATDGTQANNETTAVILSDDGRYLLLLTEANNLAAGDTNGVADVYRHDVQSGVTVWVSVGLNGQAGDGKVTGADLSEDGEWVVFSSQARNITTTPLPATCPEAPCETLYRRNMQTGVTETWIVDGNGVAIAPLRNPSLSADGQRVAYERMVLVGTGTTCQGPNTPIYGPDLYVYDGATGMAELIAESYYDEQLRVMEGPCLMGYIHHYTPSYPVLVQDTLKVTYRYSRYTYTQYNTSTDIQLLTYDPNGDDHQQAIVGTGYTSPRPAPASPRSGDPPLPLSQYALSGDGDSAIFGTVDLRLSFPPYFTPNPVIQDDANVRDDIYWFDYRSDRYVRVTNAPNGHLSNGDSRDPALSADGSVVVFASEATNLSGNDTNQQMDIFLWETIR